ncbi:hypothetical protein [Martelella mangrovi]|uniref:Uncharacterized protein n=1 Tax=Martelella mangrovi TaxID=1397477 RepID=A0ABV2IDN0_9HYPH
MSTKLMADIDAESILDAMSEDAGFALELWKELTSRLHDGALLDDAVDIISTGFDERQKAIFIAVFERLSKSVNSEL